MNWRGVILWLLGAAAVVALAIILVPGVKAQTPSAGAVPDNFWSEFYGAAKTAGFFGTLVMTLMWWLERGERKELQTILYGDKAGGGVLEKFMEAFRDIKDALKDMRGLFNSGKS